MTLQLTGLISVHLGNFISHDCLFHFISSVGSEYKLNLSNISSHKTTLSCFLCQPSPFMSNQHISSSHSCLNNMIQYIQQNTPLCSSLQSTFKTLPIYGIYNAIRSCAIDMKSSTINLTIIQLACVYKYSIPYIWVIVASFYLDCLHIVCQSAVALLTMKKVVLLHFEIPHLLRGLS